jgi:hypothetical protein
MYITEILARLFRGVALLLFAAFLVHVGQIGWGVGFGMVASFILL